MVTLAPGKPPVPVPRTPLFHTPVVVTRGSADVLLAGAARIEELELALANAAMRLTLVISRDQHKLLDVVTRDEALALLVPR